MSKSLVAPLADKAIAPAPPTEIAPLMVSVPFALRLRLPALRVAPLMSRAPLLVNCTPPLPLFTRVTAPPKLLLLPFVAKSMLAVPEPAVKLEVPLTVSAPDCDRLALLPLSAIVRLPPIVDGSSVKLAALLKLALLPLFTLTLPVKRLLLLLKSIAWLPAFKVTALAFAACTIAPVCVRSPPAVRLKLPLPSVEAPMIKALLLLSCTLLAPLLLRDTLPVKPLPLFDKSMA